MNRLFIATNIPHSTLEELIAVRDSIFAGGGVRWEPEEKLHITMRFLGDRKEYFTRKLTAALREICALPPIHLAFDRFGFFYRDGKPSILWAGFKPSSELEALYSRINAILRDLGVQDDTKPFTPHLTLLRIKEHYSAELLLPFNYLPVGDLSFHADTVVLMQSTLAPGGSIYSPVKKYSLTAG